MSRAALKPSVVDVLRAELEQVRSELAVERARRESLVDLVIAHQRLGDALAEYAQQQVRQDAEAAQRT